VFAHVYAVSLWLTVLAPLPDDRVQGPIAFNDFSNLWAKIYALDIHTLPHGLRRQGCRFPDRGVGIRKKDRLFPQTTQSTPLPAQRDFSDLHAAVPKQFQQGLKDIPVIHSSQSVPFVDTRIGIYEIAALYDGDRIIAKVF
jgi:hypothetical protein